MKASISGPALRDQLLAKVTSPAPPNREAERIEALAAPRTRELLVAIAQFRPRSISELSAIVQRHQPNVSRALASLTRAGLVTLSSDGRASVPTPTEEGLRKAAELSDGAEASSSAVSVPSAADEKVTPILKVETPTRLGDLPSDDLLGRLTWFGRHRSAEDLDLNELAVRLLKTWWRVFYRLDDPFRLCAINMEFGEEPEPANLFLRALGDQVEFYVCAAKDDNADAKRLDTRLSYKSAADLLLSRLVTPVAQNLERGRRFDRPVHSLAARLASVMASDAETTFARTAGALGLSPHEIEDARADAILRLIQRMPEEGPRLEFASSTLPEAFEASLAWAEGELRKRRQTNCFEGLRGYKSARGLGQSGWRPGKARAEALRKKLRLEDDQPVGGVEGLRHLFGGDRFQASEMADDALRGFRGQSGDDPILVVRESGPASTAFLLARAIGDYLGYADREAPISELYSNRQATGRQFAAELLAPAKGVIHMVDREGQTQMAVARHYGVDLTVVRHQYANHPEA